MGALGLPLQPAGLAGPAAASRVVAPRAAGAGAGGGSAAWPDGPPLQDMHFEMGW